MKRTLQVSKRTGRGGVIEVRDWRRDGRDLLVEPLPTFDLDVFVPAAERRRFNFATLLYKALRARGYTEEGECVS